MWSKSLQVEVVSDNDGMRIKQGSNSPNAFGHGKEIAEHKPFVSEPKADIYFVNTTIPVNWGGTRTAIGCCSSIFPKGWT